MCLAKGIKEVYSKGRMRLERMAWYLESKINGTIMRGKRRVDNLMFEASGTEEMDVPLTAARILKEKANFRVEIISLILHESVFM